MTPRPGRTKVLAACREALADQGSIGLIGAESRGLRRLYVVLTRAVSRLCIVHTDPLPAPLRG